MPCDVPDVHDLNYDPPPEGCTLLALRALLEESAARVAAHMEAVEGVDPKDPTREAIEEVIGAYCVAVLAHGAIVEWIRECDRRSPFPLRECLPLPNKDAPHG